MNEPDCPAGHGPMEWGSTSIVYQFVCKACDERYDREGNKMSEDWRYSLRPTFDEPSLLSILKKIRL